METIAAASMEDQKILLQVSFSLTTDANTSINAAKWYRNINPVILDVVDQKAISGLGLKIPEIV